MRIFETQNAVPDPPKRRAKGRSGVSVHLSVLIKLTCFATVLLITLSGVSDYRLAPSSTEEDDWWLPDWVQASPHSGVYGDAEGSVPIATVRLVDITWKEVNPAEGVYNWSRLEKALNGSSDVWLRLRSSDVIHSPEWLPQKYPDLRPMRIFYGPYPDAMGNLSQGYFYPLWHAGVVAEFRKLLQDFRRHNFGSHPRLRFAYIPGGWRWNEFQVTFVNEMIQQGMTPEKFIAWFKRTIEDYIAAFGEGNRSKLVYTGDDVVEWCDDNQEWQQKIGRSLSAYTVQRGLGQRSGFTEAFNYTVTDVPDWGTSIVDEVGGLYMVTDDKSPLVAEKNRIFATENECFAACEAPPGTGDYYHIKMATLKMLQLRMNWVFISNDYHQFPELLDYMIKVMGKSYDESPDAWVALREGMDKYPDVVGLHRAGDWWIRNWERWLIQREVAPDGYTIRTNPITSTWDLIGTSYEARRTDHANGSDYIYFGVDDKFINGGRNKIQIKVTYLDNNTDAWWIEYDAFGSQPYKHSTAVDNRGDGRWKTVTFNIADASFQNRQRDNMDFRIYNGGHNDISVRFVRVIKMEKRSFLPSTFSPGVASSFQRERLLAACLIIFVIFLIGRALRRDAQFAIMQRAVVREQV